MSSPTPDPLIQLAEQVGRSLLARRLSLATAESCTGGWVAQALTSIPGSSQWFERGFVTYSNIAKSEMLGVDTALLERFGAVSEPAVRAMAEGALRCSHAELALAVSGVAGPGGGSAQKPVGTVCFAWSGGGFPTVSRTEMLAGDRQEIRRQAVLVALRGVLDVIDGP